MAERYEVVAATTDGRRVQVEADGRTTVVDLAAAQGGPGEHPNPDETLLAALGGCTLITLQMYAKRKGWDLGAIKVRVTMDVAGGDVPPHIVQTVQLGDGLDAEQRERLEQIAGRCPIHRLLAGPMTFEDRLGIVDGAGATT
jgi:putative redox protein